MFFMLFVMYHSDILPPLSTNVLIVSTFSLVSVPHLFDLAGDDGGQLGAELLRLLEGGGEAAQVGQALHADQPRGLAVCRLQGGRGGPTTSTHRHTHTDVVTHDGTYGRLSVGNQGSRRGEPLPTIDFVTHQ